MQQVLIVVNDAPYGSEKLFNALRLAIQLNEQTSAPKVKLFLLSDAVTAVLPRQQPGEGYNLQQMLEIVLAQGAEVKYCTSCVQARGLSELSVIEGCIEATMDDLALWLLESDKVINF
ncbi:DsrE family protein [Shewanella insulae]|uniref:DsrE/DsrF/TusD sulfur relay family protein n=1 Tax=Shewanella insulae TaxID=2681496 RepID=UPI001EFE410D|nr:DsrE family protein [Shewanella insulae]MCG9755311.1 DsrE family protein [Shewanella insulae]